MAAPDSSDGHHHQGPAAPTPRRTRRPSSSTVATLVVLAVNLALSLRRVWRDDRGAIGFVAFSHLNLFLLFGAIRWLDLSPPGSPARGRARLATWILTTTLTASFTWKMGEFLPLGFAIAAWAMAAATVLAGFYLMFLAGEK